MTDKPRPGPAPKYDAAAGRRILAVLERPPPPGFARWTGPLIAAELGDVHEQWVWRFLRAQKIDLARRKSWCESNDPEFATDRGLFIDADHDCVLGRRQVEPDHVGSLRRWSERRAISSSRMGGR